MGPWDHYNDRTYQQNLYARMTVLKSERYYAAVTTARIYDRPGGSGTFCLRNPQTLTTNP